MQQPQQHYQQHPPHGMMPMQQQQQQNNAAAIAALKSEQLKFCKEVLKEVFKKQHQSFAYPFYDPVGELSTIHLHACRQ